MLTLTLCVTVSQVPVLSDPKGGANADPVTDTGPWSDLKVRHISISERISAVIWVIYHLVVAVKVNS